LYENCQLSRSQKFLNIIFFKISKSMLRIILTGKRFSILHYESICVSVMLVKISTLVKDDICTFGR